MLMKKVSVRKIDNHVLNAMRKASNYAMTKSGCVKANVGCVIETLMHGVVLGANRNVGGYNCKATGCHRVLLYGDDSKNHRLPSDCMAIHSEQDAISKAAKEGRNLLNATIYITRYPCETCARMIIASGISKVIYGGVQQASDMTTYMLESNGIDVTWIYDYTDTKDTVEDWCCNTCSLFCVENSVCGSWRMKINNPQEHKCDFYIERGYKKWEK